MKTITRIHGIFRSDVGDDVFDDLLGIYPEGQRRHAFQSFLPTDDERTRMIIDRLARAGLRPWLDRSRPIDDSTEYTLELDREYDADDFAKCKLLEFRPPPEANNYGAIERGGPNGDGDMIVPEQQMPEVDFDFLFGRGYWYFVPERIKAVLQSGDLVGVRFRPTYYFPLGMSVEDTDETVRARHGTPYWELDSDRRLPPLSPSIVLVDDKQQAVPHGSPGPCHPRIDGLYRSSELHYRASDLAKIGPFDLARTFEQFVPFGSPGDRPLIASKRFYDFCTEHRLKTGWVPVRIDPD